MRGSRTPPAVKEFDVSVGRRIELTRVAMKISCDELAARLEIARSTLYYLESGRHSCSPQMLSRIANALSVSVSALVPKS